MTLHAHAESQSRDCDGMYSSGVDYEPTLDERVDEFGDLHFKQRVISYMVNVDPDSEGTLTVRSDEVSWYERTEEGYRATEVRWCEGECAGQSWQRDHSAEAAGY